MPRAQPAGTAARSTPLQATAGATDVTDVLCATESVGSFFLGSECGSEVVVRGVTLAVVLVTATSCSSL